MKKKVVILILLMMYLWVPLNASEITNDPSFNYDECYEGGDAMYALAYYGLGFSAERSYDIMMNSIDACIDRVDMLAASYWNNN